MTYRNQQPTDLTVPAKPEDRSSRMGSAAPMARAPARGLLRVDEAADWLGLSKRKTYELVSRGELPSVHIGRSRRIALSALESFVARLAAVAGHE
jgi:excisionase family DNA binding protein